MLMRSGRSERDTFYLQAVAALLELGGAVARANGAQVREEGARLRPALEDDGDFVAKADEGGLDASAGFQLLTSVGDGARVPVNVVRGEEGGIGLGCSRVPEEFVEVAAFVVGFAFNDCGMLCTGDGAFLLEHWPWPLQARNDGFKEPFHAEGMVMYPAEVDVGGDPRRSCRRAPGRG